MVSDLDWKISEELQRKHGGEGMEKCVKPCVLILFDHKNMKKMGDVPSRYLYCLFICSS